MTDSITSESALLKLTLTMVWLDSGLVIFITPQFHYSVIHTWLKHTLLALSFRFIIL
jgi:hypothetical protein